MTEQNKFFVNNFGGIHGDDVYTPIARAAFVYLDAPNTKFVPAKYGLTLLIDKKDTTAVAQLKVIQTMCKAMALQYWKTEAKIPKDLDQPIFRDGDSEAYSKYEGFAGHWVMVAKNAKRNDFIILDGVDAAAIEPGHLVRAQVQPYCDKDGFSYKLRGLKFIRDDGVRWSVAPAGDSLLKNLDDAVSAASANATSVSTPVVASTNNNLDVL